MLNRHITAQDEALRCLRLLHLVLRDDGLNATMLAGRLNTSVRTVMRDMRRLRKIGVEIRWRARNQRQEGGYEITGLDGRLRGLLAGDVETPIGPMR